MQVKLLRDARIKHNAGEVVEVSPEEFAFLVANHAAEPVAAKPAKKTKKKEEE